MPLATTSTPALATVPRLSAFDRAMAVFLALLLPAELLLGHLAGLTLPAHLLDLWPPYWLGLLAISAIAYLLQPGPRILQAASTTLWSGLLLHPLATLILIAGRVHTPLIDPQLTAADHLLHFDTAAIVHAVARVPGLSFTLLLAYALFTPLILLAITLPALCGHITASRRFVLGVILALLLTAAIFTVTPAAGPWVTEPLHPPPTQSAMADYLLRLKSPAPAPLEIEHLAVVSFPSVHVIIAILAALALGSIRTIPGIRPIAFTLSTLVCLSTVTTGWHYGVDILGGITVAAVAHDLATRLIASLESRDRHPERRPPCLS
jgi:membrane-associated phospholipid phosphatase